MKEGKDSSKGRSGSGWRRKRNERLKEEERDEEGKQKKRNESWRSKCSESGRTELEEETENKE